LLFLLSFRVPFRVCTRIHPCIPPPILDPLPLLNAATGSGCTAILPTFRGQEFRVEIKPMIASVSQGWPSLSAGRVTEPCGVARGRYACLPLFFSNALISYREAEVWLLLLFLTLAGQASAVISSDSVFIHSVSLAHSVFFSSCFFDKESVNANRVFSFFVIEPQVSSVRLPHSTAAQCADARAGISLSPIDIYTQQTSSDGLAPVWLGLGAAVTFPFDGNYRRYASPWRDVFFSCVRFALSFPTFWPARISCAM
jgi:hypothetical protein